MTSQPYRIRPFTPADADGAAEAYRAGRPHLVTTPEVVAWQSRLPHYHLLVAELAGRVVGTARFGPVTESTTPHQGFLTVSVLPERRGTGAGTALLAAAERELAALGVRDAHSWVDETPEALGFAAARGYRKSGRAGHFGRLDLTAPLPPLPPVPPGVELRTAADFLDDPYPIYLVDIDGTRAEPGDLVLDDQPYEGWLAEIWQRPDQDHTLTAVAVADGEAVAFSAAQTDGRGAYWSAFTATRSSHRGRGLAKLAKAHSLHLAKARGLTAAYTQNDAGNAPMLAINAWFGYRECATEWKHTRSLSG
ncbi:MULTISPECIES: GNAT family N-acetyltransferase [Kitasatospora]|uniref:Putative acetyltransferase n=1 Tax=Kitasatospora setae (strain ATCC 33774 / DSM 43861 / JCM 3304 / KCC A-0304 / NBRC 14216 / KM-6054) TaxID=452652 RepID=E4NIG4_KITSK|nr:MULTISPECIES: GNAT family N-acetyltransferase [Kitasatospora]BAJ31294.1 putative acetyltransferase [Kitasatospora setae KM-6054]